VLVNKAATAFSAAFYARLLSTLRRELDAHGCVRARCVF
jgi:hypothetical protein